MGQSLWQAGLSTVASVALGLIMATGLLACRTSGLRTTFEMILSLPGFFPSLFVVLSVLSWLELFSEAPLNGLGAVVLAHVAMNAGLSAVALAGAFQSAAREPYDLAVIEGASRATILWQLFRHHQAEVSAVAMGVFGLCFTSFSVPLVLGGDNDWSLEIFSFRLISTKGLWAWAALTALLQGLGFLFLFRAFRQFRTVRQTWTNVRAAHQNLPTEMGVKSFLYLGVVVTAASLAGVLLNLSWPKVPFSLVVNTMSLGFGAGLVSVIAVLFIAYWVWDFGCLQNLDRLLLTGTVWWGLLFFLCPGPLLLRLIVGLSILLLPTAYRLFSSEAFYGLGTQVEVSKCFGASRALIFTRIVGPQLLPGALKIGAVVAFWSVGDFGFSSVVTGEIQNLALLAKNLLGGYRLEEGSGVSAIILIIGALIFLMYWGAARVLGQKLYR
jgi:thiamine transport system permease protein